MEILAQAKSEKAICTLCFWDAPISGKAFRLTWMFKNRVDQWSRHSEQFSDREVALRNYQERLNQLTSRGFYGPA